VTWRRNRADGVARSARRTFCWVPTWNAKRPHEGLEHLLVSDRNADGLVLAFDEEGRAFRLSYRLAWDESWCLREADLAVTSTAGDHALQLRADGQGCWKDGAGRALRTLQGCLDIDIWPSPFTNTFPIRRQPMTVGERREIRTAWIRAPELQVQAQSQAYTRLDADRYRFEMLDGSGFSAVIDVDHEGVVLEYEGLFRRVLAPEDGLL